MNFEKPTKQMIVPVTLSSSTSEIPSIFIDTKDGTIDRLKKYIEQLKHEHEILVNTIVETKNAEIEQLKEKLKIAVTALAVISVYDPSACGSNMVNLANDALEQIEGVK